MAYKKIEHEQTDQAGEPAVVAVQQSQAWRSEPIDDTEADGDDNPWLNDDFDPGVGPYTLEELYARIDEAEESVRRGLGKSWSQVEAELKAEFPWLS